MMTHIPIFLIIIPVVTAIIIYIVKNKHVNYLALVAQALMTGLAIVYFHHFYQDGAFQPQTFIVGLWDNVGIPIRTDGLSMSFVFLTLFSWWMVLLYTFNTKETDHDFVFFMLFLQGVFLGLLQTNDLFNMFVFVELTTIIVTILVAFNKAPKSFRAGLYYLLINTSGVLAFLIGIIFLYFTFGTINIAVITAEMLEVAPTTAMRFTYVLMMAGISVKAALFPVFTWLPKAHGAARAGISALLSGLVVKGGLYLFIRVNAMFSEAGYQYTDFFFVIGALTAIVGIVFAISQNDIKQMLAYSTVSQIGLIVIGLSSTDALVYSGGVLHIFNHAFFKVLLFMAAGMLIKVYQTKYVSEMRGVMRSMPLLGIAMLFAMLSITGAPLFNGFISKSVIMYGFDTTDLRYWVLFIANIGTATLFVKMSQIFFGPKTFSLRFHNKLQDMTLIVLSLMLIVFGTFYISIGQGFFGADFSDITFTLAKLLEYLIIIGVAYLLYRFLVRPDGGAVRSLRDFTLSFEVANYLFVTYILAMTLYFVVWL